MNATWAACYPTIHLSSLLTLFLLPTVYEHGLQSYHQGIVYNWLTCRGTVIDHEVVLSFLATSVVAGPVAIVPEYLWQSTFGVSLASHPSDGPQAPLSAVLITPLPVRTSSNSQANLCFHCEQLAQPREDGETPNDARECTWHYACACACAVEQSTLHLLQLIKKQSRLLTVILHYIKVTTQIIFNIQLTFFDNAILRFVHMYIHTATVANVVVNRLLLNKRNLKKNASTFAHVQLTTACTMSCT